MSDRESCEVQQQWQQQQQPQEGGNKEEKEEAAERIDSDYFVTKEIEVVHQLQSLNPFPHVAKSRPPTRAKYRSRVDIAAAILGVATEGAKMSRITSHAYVSYPHIKEYMTFLLDNGLLYYNSEFRK